MSVIGTGLDLVEIARMERLLDRYGEDALAKFLLPDERDYVRSRRRPALHLAARVAAKEAVYKALQSIPGARAVGWQDIAVSRSTDGRPGVVLHGKARELALARGLTIHLSLTHTDLVAAAVAVLEGT